MPLQLCLVMSALALAGGLWKAAREGSWWLGRLAWPAWAALSILIKSALALHGMSSDLTPPLSAWAWSLACLGAGLGLTLLLPNRVGALACWASAAAASALVWGDLIYYRSFGDVLTFNHLVYLSRPEHQAPGNAGALQLSSLSQFGDLSFALDLLWALPLVWLLPNSASAPQTKKRWALATAPLALLASGHALWFWWSDPMSGNLMGNRLYNRHHIKNHGLVAYHVYDAYYWTRPRLERPGTVSNDVIERRLALSRETVGPKFPHFGAAAGRNVLLIQLESFQYFVIGMEVDGQEVTPFLNSLRQQSLYSNALDQTAHGSTSDAMMIMLNSLQPPSGGPFCFLFPTNATRALPRILGERGWGSLHVMVDKDGAFWNTRLMAQHFGFGQQYFSNDLDPPGRGELVGWGLSDTAIFERLVPILQRQKQPFFCYVTTTMAHYPFVELRPHQKLLKLPDQLEGSMAGRYLQLARFRDHSLQLLVTRLQEANLWENTVLVLCGDHRSRMGAAEFRRLRIPEALPIRNRVPLFIHLPGSKVRGELPGAVGQIDVAPSLLHLLGIDNADQVFLGRNVLAGPHAGASVYGYASDGSVALRSGTEPGLYRLPSEEILPLTDPRAKALQQQIEEEIGVSDTLFYGDRILEFARPLME